MPRSKDAQKRAQETYTKNLAAEGWKKIGILFSRDHQAKLTKLAETHGSRQRAVQFLVENAPED